MTTSIDSRCHSFYEKCGSCTIKYVVLKHIVKCKRHTIRNILSHFKDLTEQIVLITMSEPKPYAKAKPKMNTFPILSSTSTTADL